ncbi:LOW QUALITY PROTEIN: bactericidal permeability-increasing protein-like [Podargus strigoides]
MFIHAGLLPQLLNCLNIVMDRSDALRQLPLKISQLFWDLKLHMLTAAKAALALYISNSSRSLNEIRVIDLTWNTQNSLGHNYRRDHSSLCDTAEDGSNWLSSSSQLFLLKDRVVAAGGFPCSILCPVVWYSKGLRPSEERSYKKTRKMVKICCSLLLLSLLSGQLNANPGLKVRITQKGLEYAKEVGLEILKKNMEKEHFPNLSGYEKFGLGNVKCNISSIHITDVEFPSASISHIPGTGIKMMTENAYLAVDMNWNIRTWMFKDSGRSTVYISKVYVTAIFSTPLDNTGHTPITSCRTTSCDIDIKLNGKSGFLHNFFVKCLKKPIHRSLVTNSCPNIRSGIQLIDEDLQSLNVLMPIDDLAEVDYSLNNLPAVFQPFIDLDLKGIVYPAGNYTGPPYMAAPFTIPVQSDSMFYLAFSEYFFQTSSSAYYTTGVFDITISEEMSRTERNGVAKYSVTPYMEVFVVLPDSTTQSLFTMNITANTSIALNLFDQKLMVSLCLNSGATALAIDRYGRAVAVNGAQAPPGFTEGRSDPASSTVACAELCGG